MLFTRTQKALLLLLIFLLYIVIGVAVPLFQTPTLSKQTKNQLAEASSFYGDEPGIDRAMLLESNESAWEERIRLLNQANEQIILTTFDMRECSSTLDLVSILQQKAQRGVSVKILLDGLNGWFHAEQSSLFRALATEPNVEIKLYNPITVLRPWMNLYRLHDKFIIVDDVGYIIGGRNTHDYFIGNYDTDSRSLDREVLVYNTVHGTTDSGQSSVHNLQGYFDHMWNSDYCQYYGEKDTPSDSQEQRLRELTQHYVNLVRQNPDLFQDLDFMSRTVPTNQITLLYNNPDPVEKEPVVFQQLVEIMKQAQEQVTFFSPYAVCNDYMLQQLRQVSAQVPDCHLVINSVENGDNFIASSDYLRHKEDILSSGFSVYEYDGGTSTHGKSLAIDDRLSIIGSYNLDLRSTYLSTETMLVIDSPELTAQLKHNFHLMEQQSRQLISQDAYMVPDGLETNSVSLLKRWAWWWTGLFLQPFRLSI